MNKKLRKFIKSPKSFFRDFFYKRMNKDSLRKISTSLSNEKIKKNINLKASLYVFLTGEMTASEKRAIDIFSQIDGNINVFYSDAENFFQLFFDKKIILSKKIDENPLEDIDQGYSLFLHSNDDLSSDFYNKLAQEVNLGQNQVITPHYYERASKKSAPLKRSLKVVNCVFETLNGLLIKNEIIKKIYKRGCIPWGMFDGSHILLAILSIADTGKIAFNKLGKYIYYKKPFGSAFRLERNENLGVSCSMYMELITRYTRLVKFGNEDFYFRCLIYSLNSFYNLGFLKKELAWIGEDSFFKKSQVLFNLIPVEYLQEFSSFISKRNSTFICSDFEKSDKKQFYLNGIDNKRKELLFVSFFKSIENLNNSLNNLDSSLVKEKKIVKHKYFNDALCFELRIWVAIPEEINYLIGLGDFNINFFGKSTLTLNKSDVSLIFKKNIYHFDFSSKYDKCWILMDRDDQADDNAEHLYRYLLGLQGFNKNIYFCLKRDSHDWDRLSQEGFSLLEYGSKDYEEALNSSEKIISSHAAAFVFDYFRDKRLFNKDLVFLQHGVIYNDLSTLFEPEWKKINLFITSAKNEYEDLTKDFSSYKFTKKEVKLTGLPRHDALLRKLRAFNASGVRDKSVLIMPTWRPYLLGAVKNGTEREKLADFTNSIYFKSWKSLLESEEIKKLHLQGVKINFFPHANIKQYLEDFELPEHINLLSFADIGIQELFVTASLMITDYSSVAFEMAYLKKPVIYYHFDDEEFYAKGAYNKGYFDVEIDGFGPVAKDEHNLLKYLDNIYMREFLPEDKYLQRMEEFFPFRDEKCCERVYQEIIGLDRVDKISVNKEKILLRLLSKNNYKEALKYIESEDLTKQEDLKEFLKWKVLGIKPNLSKETIYREFYYYDLRILNFEYDINDLDSIGIKINNDLEGFFFNKLMAVKRILNRHLAGDVIEETVFEEDVFYAGMVNSYLSANWDELFELLSLKKNSDFFSNLSLKEWDLYRLLSISMKDYKYKILIDLYFDKFEFKSTPIKLFKSIVLDRLETSAVKFEGLPFEKKSLIFCGHFE